MEIADIFFPTDLLLLQTLILGVLFLVLFTSLDNSLFLVLFTPLDNSLFWCCFTPLDNSVDMGDMGHNCNAIIEADPVSDNYLCMGFNKNNLSGSERDVYI